MFDQFRIMGQLAGLMKDRERMRQAAERLRERLDALEVDGEAGGGAARAVVSGTMRVRRVEVDPALADGMARDDRTRALASDLIAEAVNDGLMKAFREGKRLLDEEAAGLGLAELAAQVDVERLFGGSHRRRADDGPPA